MRFILLSLGLAFSLTACNEEDLLRSIVGSAPVPPDGQYESLCQNSKDDSTSSRSFLEIEGGSYMNTFEAYALADCEGPASSSEVTQGSVDFKGIDLGSNVSFLEIQEDGGKAFYAPYLYANERLYFGSQTEDVNNPEDIFSDFVASPIEEALIIYERVVN